MKQVGKVVVVGLLCGLVLAGAPAGAASPAARVDLNAASADELAKLPGIGPAKAQAIVEHRAHESFAKVEDLRKVKGIGPKLYEQVKEHVTVGDGGVAASKPGRGS